MNKENQEVYVSPQVEVIEIKAQAIICQSGNLEDRDYIDPWDN